MNSTRPPQSIPTGKLLHQRSFDLPRLGCKVSSVERERIVLPKASRPLTPAHIELLKVIAADLVEKYLAELEGPDRPQFLPIEEAPC